MRRIAAALGCALLVGLAGPGALACTDPGGIGGTGIDPGGIGGTGQRAEADVGLLGVITGFASICVNGVEVHYDAKTPVSLNGEPAAADALAVGQVVAVRAMGRGTQARARAIDIVDSAVGPVVAIDAAAGSLELPGQRIRVQPTTMLGDGITGLDALQVGATLRVSGLPAADGTIVATRIEAAPPGAKPIVLAAAPDLGSGRFVVQGYVAEVQPQALRLGALSFSVAPELGAQLERDRLVRVAGRIEAGRHIAERVDVLARPLDVRPERRLQIEPRRREPDDRRGGRSGRDGERSATDGERSGRGGPDPGGRPERLDRSGPGDQPERIDRSGSNSGRR